MKVKFDTNDRCSRNERHTYSHCRTNYSYGIFNIVRHDLRSVDSFSLITECLPVYKFTTIKKAFHLSYSDHEEQQKLHFWYLFLFNTLW